MIYPDTLSMDDLVVEIYELRRQLLAGSCTESDRETMKTARRIRSDIKDMKSPCSFPYVSQFSAIENDTEIPQSLQLLLSNIITSATDRITNQQLLRTKSIAADVIYAASSGRIKMQKHVLLPFGIKSLTGNVELIHILNRLGHGIAYSQLLDIETAIAMQQQQQNTPVIPANVLPNIFTTIAWDNIDNCEETLTGAGTSHRVNGIAIQCTVQGPQPCSAMQPTGISRTRCRSLQAVDLPLPSYTAVARVGPGKCDVVDADYGAFASASFRSNLIWALSRHLSSEKQSVPSWTGFNIRTRSDQNVTADHIVYLPPVDGPASSMATVWELLNRSVHIQKQLGLSSVVCVFDQALYAKVAEVVWTHKDKFSTVVLCLGVFHTICTLLRIIGKRFADAGLRDLMIETGLVAMGSVAAVLEGRHYNHGMRAHKMVYEGMLRLAWKHFHDNFQAVSSDADRLTMADALYNISQLNEDLCEIQMCSILQLESVQFLITQFESFLNVMRTANGQLSAFWMSYVDVVNLMRPRTCVERRQLEFAYEFHSHANSVVFRL